MEIPIVRRANDLFLSVTIQDRQGNPVDWFALSNISAQVYSRHQRAYAGYCELGEIIDGALQIKYDARMNYQYLGINDLVLIFDMDGRTQMLQKSFVEFVPFSYLQAKQIPDKIDIEFVV